MVFRDMFVALGYISRIYFVVMGALVFSYLLRHFWLHRALFRLGQSASVDSNSQLSKIESHFIGLRQAQHIALGLGRALFAAQLSMLLYEFSPVMRATDGQPWYSVPAFLILCQTCFLPALILLFLEWLLSVHVRHVTLPH
jgi:hypothetical protein